jgi:NADPH:quinone reductase-like Zn-dependent oxidoreductase
MPRAWVIHEYSGYEGLRLEDVEVEEPGPGEIRLRIEAFALNWGDMDLMRGMYSFGFREFPARIGIEAAGIVDAVGPGVSDIELGSRMCTLPYFYYQRGVSAESVIIEQRYVTPAPAGLTAVESASIWMQYMTAYFPIVEESQAGPGRTILATAGTATAASAALRIGRRCGATMITTTRSAHNRAYLEEIGADHVFVDDGSDLAAYLRDVTAGSGVNAVFDAVGAGMLKRYAPALAKHAQVHWYGFLDGELPDLPLIDLVVANAVLHPYSLFNYVEDAEMCAKGTAFVYEALADGSIQPLIDRVYPMEDYRDAWTYVSEPRSSHGKVVIETGL